MATATTKPRKTRQVKPAHGVARLTLTIDATNYAVRPLPVERGSGVSRLVQLRKLDGSGEVYHASLHRHGAECTCASWIYDHADDGTPCKHLAALQGIGMMPKPITPGHPATWPSWCDDDIWTIGHTADIEAAERQASYRAAAR